MSVIAVAIVGSSVVGGVIADQGSRRQSAALADGAESSAQATIETTQMQLGEIQRQFDYQQQVLMPRIEQQYGAMGIFSELMGITPGTAPSLPSPSQTQQQGPQTSTLGASQQQSPAAAARIPPVGGSTGSVANYINSVNRQNGAMISEGNNPRLYPQSGLASSPRQSVSAAGVIPQPVSSGGTPASLPPAGVPANANPGGYFVDRNINPTRLADTQTLSSTVQNNLQAGSSMDDDRFRNYIQGNSIAAPSIEDDLRYRNAKDVTMTAARSNEKLAADKLSEDIGYNNISGRQLVDGAAGTGVYGEDFTTSPGYAFAKEEMQRQLERGNSAGGNYGGRAIMEAQRRAEGLAAQEYYNWAAGRTSDLSRQAQAESADAGRLDASVYNFINRQGQDVMRGDSFAATDIGRTDTAVAGYDNQRIADIGREDQAVLNYLQRQQGDAARLDSAAANADNLSAIDRQREDQAYYNYLQNISRASGMSDAVSQSVGASANASSAVTNAYGAQGSNLSSIYANLGNNQASVQGDRYENINNAIQSGIGNYITYNAAQVAA